MTSSSSSSSGPPPPPPSGVRVKIQEMEGRTEAVKRTKMGTGPGSAEDAAMFTQGKPPPPPPPGASPIHVAMDRDDSVHSRAMDLQSDEWIAQNELFNQTQESRRTLVRETAAALDQIQMGHNKAQAYAQQVHNSVYRAQLDLQQQAANARRAHSEELKRKEAEMQNRLRQEEANIRRQLEIDRASHEQAIRENARLRKASQEAHRAEVSMREQEVAARKKELDEREAVLRQPSPAPTIAYRGRGREESIETVAVGNDRSRTPAPRKEAPKPMAEVIVATKSKPKSGSEPPIKRIKANSTVRLKATKEPQPNSFDTKVPRSSGRGRTRSRTIENKDGGIVLPVH